MAHRKYLDIFVLSAFIVALFSGATAARPRFPLASEPRLCVPTGTTTMLRIIVLPTATMAQIGSVAGCSSERAPGITVLAAFMGTSTIAMIPDMVTPDRCPHAGSRRSTSSTRTKHGIAMVT